jgi:DNA-binding cell septation regulator SpoVG
VNAPLQTRDVVTDVHVDLAPPHLAAAGLLAFATVVVGVWRVSGIRVRRSLDGRLYVAFPEHRSSSGMRDPYAVPLDGAVFSAVKNAVVAEYLRAEAHERERA